MQRRTVGSNVYRRLSDLKEADVGNFSTSKCLITKDEDCAEYLNRFNKKETGVN